MCWFMSITAYLNIVSDKIFSVNTHQPPFGDRWPLLAPQGGGAKPSPLLRRVMFPVTDGYCCVKLKFHGTVFLAASS